jgi:hypothetical protein
MNLFPKKKIRLQEQRNETRLLQNPASGQKLECYQNIKF